MKCMNRKAVTLIEVIFSIGVVLIGLLGLLSLMPLAGKRSQEAISLAAASALGDSVMNELLSRKPISNGLLSNMSNAAVTYNTTTTPAQLQVGGSPVGGICIDPIYKGNQAPLTSNHYNDRFFPYFIETHDPLLNPSVAGNPWPSTQPRLTRVGANHTLAAPSVGRSEQARAIAESNDAVTFERPKDRADDAVLPGLKTNSSHLLSYGKRVPSGEYSWIATVCPLAGGRFASVSVVVVRNRDTERDYPSGLETVPLRNSVSERLAYVADAAGFSGGAGGTVLLAGSQTTLSQLRSNDWVMLSTRVSVGPPPVDVHRWFRVVSVDSEPVLHRTTHALPDQDTVLNAFVPTAVGTDVWLRRVQLDGVDWRFSFINDNPANDPPMPAPPLTPAERYADNTYATILTDVVSVTERVVPLSSL
jgi:Tfp pilus assembly protein PilV